jgi:DNA-binding transcriptional ArsR family regulator
MNGLMKMKTRSFPLNARMIEPVARRFRVLGEPQRLRILQILEKAPKNVSDIAERLGVSQPNVSRHLRALFEAGLITRRRSGTSAVYSVSDPLVFRLCGLVCDSVVERARADLKEIALAGSTPAARGSN